MMAGKTTGLALIGLGFLLLMGKLLLMILNATKLPLSIKTGIISVIIGAVIILMSMIMERGREKK